MVRIIAMLSGTISHQYPSARGDCGTGAGLISRCSDDSDQQRTGAGSFAHDPTLVPDRTRRRYHQGMAAGSTIISVEEYLSTTYRPNCDYIDGVVRAKALPTLKHVLMEAWLPEPIRRGL